MSYARFQNVLNSVASDIDFKIIADELNLHRNTISNYCNIGGSKNMIMLKAISIEVSKQLKTNIDRQLTAYSQLQKLLQD